MRHLILAASVALGLQLSQVELEFEEFQAKFHKQYTTEAERTARLRIFEVNLAIAKHRNRENIAAGGTAVHGVTKFSDLTPDEFRSHHLTSILRTDTHRGEGSTGNSGVVDWRTKGAVLPVESEGQCGSTWAFAVKESIESFAVTEAGKPLVKLSAQQIVSCDKVDAGCNGGNPNTAYDYVIKAGGLETDADYPYTSENGTVARCKFDKTKIAVTIANYTMVPKGEKNVHDALSRGPPGVCVGAQDWQTYTGGVMTSCKGPMDHCAQAVGYDDDNKPPYWIVRNQWGTDWGEQGYIRIAQGKDLCLIGDLAFYPSF